MNVNMNSVDGFDPVAAAAAAAAAHGQGQGYYGPSTYYELPPGPASGVGLPPPVAMLQVGAGMYPSAPPAIHVSGGGEYFDSNSQAPYQDFVVSSNFVGPENMYYEQQQSYSPTYAAAKHPNTRGSITPYSEGPWDQHQHPHQRQIQHQQDATEMSAVPAQCLPGSYYPVSPLIPQLFGSPVSSIAYDNTVSAIYVASPTQAMSQGRRWNHRASMLVTHSTLDGMLYASVAGHPEASTCALQAVYQSIYGNGNAVSELGCAAAAASQPQQGVMLPGGRRHIPSHAYRPPYGSSNIAQTLPDMGKGTYHMGINTLLPLSGNVASVSPSAVRIHAHGGLQMADNEIEGMVCGTVHPRQQEQQNSGTGDRVTTHVTVGGIAFGGNSRHVYCMDIWQGLRVVNSRAFNFTRNNSTATISSFCGVTALATSHSRGSIVAGCSDGQIRVLDGSLRELATIRSHTGGVNNIAVSNDGMLIATTGYGSRSAPTGPGNSFLYAFPDPNILIYDIRYLGRGGVAHPFAGLRGGPRFLSFVPDKDGQPSNRLIVASGLAGGGLQIISPFDALNDSPSNFLLPQVDRGEHITAMTTSEADLALGTSTGRILRYKMAAYDNNLTEKQPLEMPSFVPPLPPLSIEPTILRSENPNVRNGTNEKIKSLFTAYCLRAEPTLTPLSLPGGTGPSNSFGPLANTVRIPPSKRNVSTQLVSKGSPSEGDFAVTIPTSILQLNLLQDHSRYNNTKAKREARANPNKLLYSKKLYSICYEAAVNNTLRREHQRSRKKFGILQYRHNDEINHDSFTQYRLNMRPSYKSAGTFDFSEYNDTGLLPGWDYPPTMPNAFASPVLFLLYFNPLVRSAILSAQCNERLLSNKATERNLVLELGFLFHQIECLSQFALSYPPHNLSSHQSQTDVTLPRLGAWVPSNFLASLATMPEADQLQILDGSPAAVETPRRPEAFYRFLLYHLDKELSKILESKIMDSMYGVDFVSVNEFITGSGPPSHSTTRGLTVDLSYEVFVNNHATATSASAATPTPTPTPTAENYSGSSSDHTRFGQVLQHALCRETRLRAWNQRSRSYETIVQRKIATSLPDILSLSCACAGRKEEDGLMLWRTDAEGHWLPEILEVELEDGGDVVVRELVKGEASSGSSTKWETYRSRSSIPSAVSKLVEKHRTESSSSLIKIRYQLDAVVAFIRDDVLGADGSIAENCEGDEAAGHHVLHMRIPTSYKKRVWKQRLAEIRKLLSANENGSKGASENNDDLFSAVPKVDKKVLGQREEFITKCLEDLESNNAKDSTNDISTGNSNDNDWVLFNGFVVSETSIDNARAFHLPFKEPCLVVFRAVVDDKDIGSKIKPKNNKNNDTRNRNSVEKDGKKGRIEEIESVFNRKIAPEIMQTRSITNGSPPNYLIANDSGSTRYRSHLPGPSDLIAFDAEFVSVQEEESELTETGSKITLRETRHAVARISVLDCKTRSIIIDDHILPKEPVVDYLTRFSGIVAKDLDPRQSPHHLISTRSAYLKLRYLMERGCIFVGHGLCQDFWLMNLVVPCHQIIDTVEIFHQDRMRYISLRFLANYVLGRDMQQDTHDSLEDALAAYELYLKSIELKKNGTFDQFLNDLYDYGRKTDWKVGVEAEDEHELSGTGAPGVGG